ncbi:hypothetical protein BD410DRAFT_797466, partial [Rickenella mellea]
MDIPQALLWINGQTRKANTNETFEVHNPLTKKLVSISASATSEDCKDAVEAAAHAFASWEQVNSAEGRTWRGTTIITTGTPGTPAAKAANSTHRFLLPPKIT